MKVHPSALKHGVEEPDAVQAAEWPLWIEPLDDDDDDDGPPHRELRLGFDTGARLLETIVLVFEDGAELVIHAMPAARSTSTCCPDRTHSSAAGRVRAVYVRGELSLPVGPGQPS